MPKTKKRTSSSSSSDSGPDDVSIKLEINKYFKK